MSAIRCRRAAEGVIQPSDTAEAVRCGGQTEESARQLFVPDAQIGVRRRIGVGVVGESAVVVVKSVARVINRAAALGARPLPVSDKLSPNTMT